MSALGAGAGGKVVGTPFRQFLHASNPRLIVASHVAPDAATAPPMETMGIGHLVRAVTALWAPSHVRSHRLHCQWLSILQSW